MKYYVLLSLFILTFSTGASATQSAISKSHILAAHPDQTYALELSGKKLLVTVKNQGTKRIPKDILSIYLQRNDSYLLLTSINAGPGGAFDQPHTFSSQGLNFVYAPTLPAGSAGFVDQNIFWLAPDDSIHRVNFQPASQEVETTSGEIVLTGGDKDFFVEDDQLKFKFWVAKPGDPHCCPTGGTVSGTYKLVGHPTYDFFSRKYSDDIRIEIDSIQQADQNRASLR